MPLMQSVGWKLPGKQPKSGCGILNFLLFLATMLLTSTKAAGCRACLSKTYVALGEGDLEIWNSCPSQASQMHSAFSHSLTGADREQGIQRHAYILGQKGGEAAQSRENLPEGEGEKSTREEAGLVFLGEAGASCNAGQPSGSKELFQDQDSSWKDYKAGRDICNLLPESLTQISLRNWSWWPI